MKCTKIIFNSAPMLPQQYFAIFDPQLKDLIKMNRLFKLWSKECSNNQSILSQ